MRWYKSPLIIQMSLLITVGLFVILPLLWVLIQSFQNPIFYTDKNFFIFVDRYLSLEQYKNVLFHDLEYWVAYWNTIFLTLPTIFMAICVVSMVAYGLTIMNQKMQRGILTVYAILALLPMQMLLVPHLITLSGINLNGTRLAVVLVYSSCPWYVFFLHRLCKRIPKEIFETARMEGAGEWAVFRRIALPQMKSGIMILSIIISADLWGMIEEPLVYMQEPSKYPLSVLFHEMGTPISYAGIVIFSLPIILIFFSGIRETLQEQSG